jgi:TonB family protein
MTSRTRTLAVVALCATFLACSGVCQSIGNAASSELAPQRIAGLQYPRLAHLALIQGKVELEANVSVDGAVKEVKVVSGHALLIDAAKDSLRQWRFTGCTPSSERCNAGVTFVFVLEKGLCDIDQCPKDLQIDLPGVVTITSKQARAIVN